MLLKDKIALITGSTHNIGLAITRAFALDHPYTVRATLILDVGSGDQSGHWSDTFIERVFPIRERAQSVTREIRF